ncbi:hypothetical protein KPSB59_2750028 [Klebsiella quasipneumoniae subsp. quasipneumoniae]|nr:hypothetical protein KPSB59_2750028 [Klebsiella quasipneumoniae subsp. quasipneumoniae]
MDEFGFGKIAGLNPVVYEGFSKASIRHDEFQINKAIWLHLMFHLPPLVTAKCLPRSSNSS